MDLNRHAARFPLMVTAVSVVLVDLGLAVLVGLVDHVVLADLVVMGVDPADPMECLVDLADLCRVVLAVHADHLDTTTHTADS